MDKRLAAFAFAVISVMALGLIIYFAPNMNQGQAISDVPNIKAPDPKFAVHMDSAIKKEVDTRFKQAVVMLHAKKYDHAITALSRTLKLAPKMPEAHVNMGFALIGLGEYKSAADHFNTAINLRPGQVNAYYGLSLSFKELGNIDGAVGAMRTYIHLAPSGDPYVGKARALLTELEVGLAEERRKFQEGMR